jgi:hypothetical protein
MPCSGQWANDTIANEVGQMPLTQSMIDRRRLLVFWVMNRGL